MNVIYMSRANGEFAVVYCFYAHWLLNEGNSSKGGSMEPTEPPLDPQLGWIEEGDQSFVLRIEISREGRDKLNYKQ